MCAEYKSNVLGQEQFEIEMKRVLEFWFPDTSFQEFWFSTEYDAQIRNAFMKIWEHLKVMKAQELSDLVNDAKDKQKAVLGICIILDQFSRNLLRSDDRSVYGPTDELMLSFMAKIGLCTYIQEHTQRDESFQSWKCKFIDYPIHQRIFLLLPFRHQRRTPLLDFVMLQIKDMEREIEGSEQKHQDDIKTCLNIISRFKTATIKDYTKVQDTITHVTNTTRTSTHLIPEFSGSETKGRTAAEILERLNRVLDEHCTANYSLTPVSMNHSIEETSVYRDTVKFLHKYKIRNVCISLSGGVDSMVLSYILVRLKAEGKINNLCAVHVDYGNREVSRDEAMIVADWCRYTGIPFITRRIEHMKRDGPTILMDSVDRTLYESETKNIRFNLYKKAMELYNVESVMLGHHRDDLSENVLMNVLRGGEVLNLFTMRVYQKIDGVPVSRPMIGLPKSDIYCIAHRVEIPYLKDTTPEDCFRGTVRKIVFPALQKIDPHVLLKINKIGMSSERWSKVVGTQVIEPMVSSVKRYPHGFILPFKESYLAIDEEVWKSVLSQIFHGAGIKMISNKNLINFVKWLRLRSGFTRLSNGYMASVSNVNMIANTVFNTDTLGDSLLFIRSELVSRIQNLPTIPIPELNSQTREIPVKIRFDIAENTKMIAFNGWTIQITRIFETTDHGDEHQIEFDSRFNMQNILNGSFYYFYRSCSHATSKDADTHNYRFCSVEDDSLDRINLNYSMGHKSSDNKRFFKGMPLCRYIPMVHLGIQCKECRIHGISKVFKIEYCRS